MKHSYLNFFLPDKNIILFFTLPCPKKNQVIFFPWWDSYVWSLETIKFLFFLSCLFASLLLNGFEFSILLHSPKIQAFLIFHITCTAPVTDPEYLEIESVLNSFVFFCLFLRSWPGFENLGFSTWWYFGVWQRVKLERSEDDQGKWQERKLHVSFQGTERRAQSTEPSWPFDCVGWDLQWWWTGSEEGRRSR